MLASTSLLLLLFTFGSAHTITTSTPPSCPFSPPIHLQNRPANPLIELFRRQNLCEAGFNACSAYGVSTVCCSPTATCTTDTNNVLACCSTGAACTGYTSTPGAAISATSTSGLLLGATTTTGNSLLITSAASFVQSTVPNQYFPFVYIPTAFANAAACSSYFTSCQAEYTSCITSLGGQVGVVATTTSATNIQLTARQAATNSAQSICSSLYSVGCYNLQEGYCSSVTGGSTVGTGITVFGNGAKRTVGLGMWNLAMIGLGMVIMVVGRL